MISGDEAAVQEVSDTLGRLNLDLSFQNDKAAEMLAYLPNVERINNHSVRFVGSIIEISMFIEFALGYPSTIN